MDGYGQVGPEKPDYAADCEGIRDMLESGNTVYVAFAADHSRVNLILASRDHLGYLRKEWEPDVPVSIVGVPPGNGYLMVAVIDRGAYWIQPGAHYGYIADKLGLEDKDGENVAEFLSRLAPTPVEP